MAATRLQPGDLKTKRRLADVNQAEIGAAFYPRPISKSAVSDFEKGEKPLPFGYTPDDYSAALTRAAHDKRAVA